MVAKETGYRRRKRHKPPLDAAQLQDLALAYVARYATSGAKLSAYLERKIRERGFDAESEPDIAGLVSRYRELGYIDDAAYARSRAEDLKRRGYGPRRIDQALRGAGIGEGLRSTATACPRDARQAAVTMAQRRRFGPFGEPVDRAMREKRIAAMIRAGHSFDDAKVILDAQQENELIDWIDEAEG